jgi:hypothetical protein
MLYLNPVEGTLLLPQFGLIFEDSGLGKIPKAVLFAGISTYQLKIARNKGTVAQKVSRRFTESRMIQILAHKPLGRNELPSALSVDTLA